MRRWPSGRPTRRCPSSVSRTTSRSCTPNGSRQLLDGGRPEAAPAGRFLLFHVNFGVPEEYEENHLPGALYLDTNQLENPVDWNRRTPEELEAALRAHGITHDTTVILYGRDTEGDADEKWPGRRAGQIAATRAALILRYAGVDDIRLLDGGYDAWVRAGNPLETDASRAHPGRVVRRSHPAPPGSDRRHRRGQADRRRLRRRRARQRPNLERAHRQGQRLQLHRPGRPDRRRRVGQLRHATPTTCSTTATWTTRCARTRRSRANWEEAGITSDKWVAFYCGTGWRASETWFYAYLMGWQRVAVYDGGWYEWSQNPVDNPIEVGEPADELAA